MAEIPPGAPFLERYDPESGRVEQIVLDAFPFTIGRSPSTNLRIDVAQVSREHAALVRTGSEIRVKDLGSTNGTFVNGRRLDQEVALNNGDVLHVATLEFSFRDGRPAATETNATQVVETLEMQAAESGSARSIIRNVRHLQEMLTHRCIRVVFQPVVRLETEQIIGYEALGRGDHKQLSQSPLELFQLATECRLTERLSQLFRTVAIEEAAHLPPDSCLFINLHPAEIVGKRLIQSLHHAQTALLGQHRLIVEVEEGVLSDLSVVTRLHADLAEAGIGLAYDNFKAGQVRMRELVEAAPPEYVKLDIALVKSIDVAPARKKLAEEIVRLGAELDVRVVAKGIETVEQAAVWRELGCDLAQGYLFGRPQPVTSLSSACLT